jgi:uncharacterized protein YfiM (DUF2279 family)
MTLVLKEEGNMTTRRKTRRNESIEYSLVYGACYGMFLVAAAAARLVPKGLRWSVSGDDSGKSIFATASSAAHNSLPQAFM